MIRTLLWGDWATKGVALVMATLLWTYLYWQRNEEFDAQAVLRVNTPPSVARVEVFDAQGAPLSAVPLRVSAPRSLAQDLRALEIPCVVDLGEGSFTESEKGSLSVSLGRDHLRGLPASAAVQFVPSAQLTIRYWKYKTVKVPVRMGPPTAPPEGYAVGNVTIEPAAVQVQIASDRPAPEFLELPPIDLTNQRVSIQRDVELRQVPGDILVQKQVRVTIDLTRKPVERELRLKCQLVPPPGGIPYVWELNREDARVRLKGDPDDLAKITDKNSTVLVLLPADEIPKPENFAGPEDKRILKSIYLKTEEKGMRYSIDYALHADDEIVITFKKKT
jgi:hypothetical protein